MRNLASHCARTGENGDMLKEGIFDPFQVTRLALQHAVSVPGLLLRTKAAIAEAPKKVGHQHGTSGV